MRVGIFDSGLGGLTVLRALMREVPEAEYVYLGDTARTPYGSKSRSTISRYSKECATFLLSHEIDLLVVACNTASSYALETLQKLCPCPVIGTIEPAVKSCLEKVSGGAIGVIGTRATISSSVYEQHIRAISSSATVISKACPLFVPLVEEGIFEGPILERIIELYLSPLKYQNLDALILACTHYPIVSGPIANYFEGRVAIVDCAEAISHQVRKMFDRGAAPQKFTGSPKQTLYYVTDEVSRFNYLASLLMDGATVEAVKLDEIPV